VRQVEQLGRFLSHLVFNEIHEEHEIRLDGLDTFCLRRQYEICLSRVLSVHVSDIILKWIRTHQDAPDA
jgi:hypothetical protein